MMQVASKLWYALEIAAETFEAYEIGNPRDFSDMHKLCSWSGPFCDGVLKMLAHKPWNNLERWTVKADRHNSGTSLKEMIHYAQIVKTGELKLFDYHNS